MENFLISAENDYSRFSFQAFNLVKRRQNNRQCNKPIISLKGKKGEQNAHDIRNNNFNKVFDENIENFLYSL